MCEHYKTGFLPLYYTQAMKRSERVIVYACVYIISSFYKNENKPGNPTFLTEGIIYLPIPG